MRAFEKLAKAVNVIGYYDSNIELGVSYRILYRST